MFSENGLDFAFCVKCGTKLNGNSNTTSSTVTASSIKSNEKPKSITSNTNEYQYNTTQRDTDSSGMFGNPATLIMMIVLAIVILTVLTMR